MIETNELTRKLRTLLHPRAALIVYTQENNSHSMNDNSYFIEVRDIDESGRMGEGRPVTVEFMNELVRGYSESHSTTPYGRIPSNLLWCDPRKGSEKYIWYNPPRKRMMFFKEALKIENAEYHLPGIIYEAGENRLNVYAYKDIELTDKTESFCSSVLQCDWSKRLFRFRKNRKAERPDLHESAGVLGEEILADGIFPSRQRWKPHEIQSCTGNERGKGQAFRP